MDEIQRTLIKAGRKDLAQKYYIRIKGGVSQDEKDYAIIRNTNGVKDRKMATKRTQDIFLSYNGKEVASKHIQFSRGKESGVQYNINKEFLKAAKKGSSAIKKWYLSASNITATKFVNKEDAFNAFLKGKIGVEELNEVAENLGTQIATKEELNMFLKNKFMQDVMSDTHNIPNNVIIKKVKELLKYL